MHTTSNRFLRVALSGLLVLTLASITNADDRQLITGFVEIPTVFFLFDTSGSMHWSSQCLQEDFDAGDCDYLCPSGDCWVPGNGDSPNSKLYQAKEAIFEVINQSEDINVGLATFNQDALRLRRKHWLYEAVDDGPDIAGFGPYPRGRTATTQGDLHTFGASWPCTTGQGGNPDVNIGCGPDTPANLGILWDSQRVAALPKETPDFDPGNDVDTVFYVTAGTDTWEIRFRARAADDPTLGDATIPIEVHRGRCEDSDCDDLDMEQSIIVNFELVSDYDYWEFTTARGPARAGFFSQGISSDSPASNTCVSWDANTDTPADIFDGYNARFPTVADLDFSPLLDIGDVLPIDWRNDNRQELLHRLAPNLRGGALVPDFRVATYFEDIVVPSQELHLKDEAERPIIAFGGTPIGTSVQAFYNFVNGSGPATGWIGTAEANDPSFFCRQTYLIVITDGNQSTCDGDDPCDTESTAELFEDLGIRTFVVAFGVPPHIPLLPLCSGDPDEIPNTDCCASDAETLCTVSTSSTIPPDAWPPIDSDPPTPARVNRSLRCMASTGGTGSEDYDGDGVIDSEDGSGVIYPQNQDELVNALVAILDQIKPAPTAFSTAAVPSVQAEAADKVFLSDFTPIPERAAWMGRVNAFLKPLPVDDEDRPDTSKICPIDDIDDPNDDPSACLLWEAGDVILTTQVTPGDPVGEGVSQRQIYYGELTQEVPRRRHFFKETTTATPEEQEFDLFRGFDIDFDPDDTDSIDDARVDAAKVVNNLLKVKQTPVNEDFPIALDYVLGDIFHSDPLLLASPNNLLYFFADLFGYRQFAFDNAFRRRVLMFGTNSGILHGIDAGVCRELSREDPRPCLFDNGTGREVFGVVPRVAMPTISQLAFDTVPRHRFNVDGRTQAADVRIDTIHDGALSIDPPNDDDREWRTVLVGGLREGGNLVPEDIGDLSSPEDANTTDTVLPQNQPTSGYYAIDVTTPDPLQPVPPGENRPPIPEDNVIPACLASIDGITPTDTDCGSIAYASVLWEFTDTLDGLRLDEDDNGHVDLAFTWSNPNIGRIQICTGACESTDPELEDRYVAVFGGGYDPDSPFLRGNFLYIVDIETGETIYKQVLVGAAAAEPAAVDTNFDGYLDTIYIGTSLGELYRVTIGPLDADGDPGTPPKFPLLETVTISETDLDGIEHTRDVERIAHDTGPGTSPDTDFWPHVLLHASDPDTEALDVRPIFFRPSVIFLPEFNRYAIAVGTGNREDIFDRQEDSGRFFTFVDNVEPVDLLDLAFTPFSPATTALMEIDPMTTSRLEETSLLNPGQGWWFNLADNERLVTEPFALSGILFFSTFIPDPAGPEVIPEESLCREQGVSNIYGVFTDNADGLLTDDPSIDAANQLTKFITVTGLVSSPFTEQSQTKNPPPQDGDNTIDDISESPHLQYIRDRLKEQFPENCTFPPGYRIDVKTRNSSTKIDFIAPVPICVVEKSFREF